MGWRCRMGREGYFNVFTGLISVWNYVVSLFIVYYRPISPPISHAHPRQPMKGTLSFSLTVPSLRLESCPAHMNRISALMRHEGSCSLSLLPAMRGFKKSDICPPGRGSLPAPWTLILDFSTAKTVKNKCLLFKPPSVWYFCNSSPNRLR